ncbi:TPA: oxygen-regulated invasion protein OrgA [Salmonella enterica subsp. enterica serovar Typhimurium]|nr:oxygen-regulated invasion protein OrgA [Salmonella enterica]HAR9941917.1 oxygen-regulated invasion protein OrgA [Salmonella enterica subsp. enterica serovar Typhimurium]
MIRRNRQMNRQPLPIIWQRIIFDPLSYIHPQRLQIAPEMIVRPAARAAANELILAAWRLKNGEKECIQNSLTLLWLRQWRRLPQVAYLLGCHKLRADLARQGALLGLPDWAQAFLAMHQGTSLSVCNKAPNHRFLLSVGYAQLNALNEFLPESLAQRFPLLFPPFIEEALKQDAVEMSILLLALQYAQKYPNTVPAFAC